MKVLPFLMLFFFESPGQRKTAREKRNPMFRGTFCKKVTKTRHTITQNSLQSYTHENVVSLNATDHIPVFGKKIDRPLGSFIPLHGSDLNVCSRIFIPVFDLA